MLMGLKDPAGDNSQEFIKMSKSDPMSAIFMEDSEEEVRTKVKSAYCPIQIVEKNPCMEYVKYIIFGALPDFQIERKEELGGNK